eukprot:4350509-Amphidinium_carterae.1
MHAQKYYNHNLLEVCVPSSKAVHSWTNGGNVCHTRRPSFLTPPSNSETRIVQLVRAVFCTVPHGVEVFVGRLTAQKGVDLLGEIMEWLMEDLN